MATSYDKFLEELKVRVTDQFKTKIEATDEATGDLYHYTSTLGLMGMLESASLWLTDHRFLNDPTEGLLAAALLEEAGEAWIETAKHRQLDKVKAKEQRDDIRTCIELLRAHSEQPLRQRFVACFSEDVDSLSQFRAYGNYCLRFDVTELARLLGVPAGGQGVGAFKMIYDRDKNYRRIQLALKFSLETAEWARKTYGPQNFEKHRWRTGLYQGLYQLFMFEGINMKPPAFSTEREYRLACLTGDEVPPELKFRERAGQLIPYLVANIGHEALPNVLKEISCGPNTDPRAVEMLVARYCVGVKVRHSGILLRS